MLHAVAPGPEGHLFVVENFWYDGVGRIYELDPDDLECTANPADNPPAIRSITPSPAVRWPPNNKLVSVRVSVLAEDDSGEPPTCRVTQVGANETLRPGDVAIGADLNVWLRAQRSGPGDGRTYTLLVVCEDAARQQVTAQAQVLVPHDRGKNK